MSANPHRQTCGKSLVLLADRETHKLHEESGFFGNFHEAYWWAQQNGYELRRYTAIY